MVSKKQERLKQCKVSPEILYLMKHESLSLQYLALLSKSNERLKDLVDWFECEAVFWDWLDQLFRSFDDERDDEVTNLEVSMTSMEDGGLERCRIKLFELESLSKLLERLWSDAVKKGDVSLAEVVGDINAKVFIDNTVIGVESIPQTAAEKDHFESINIKLSHTIQLFNTKYEKKLKKLSKYINGSILE